VLPTSTAFVVACRPSSVVEAVTSPSARAAQIDRFGQALGSELGGAVEVHLLVAAAHRLHLPQVAADPGSG
jgi:hypothetical protein